MKSKWMVALACAVLMVSAVIIFVKDPNEKADATKPLQLHQAGSAVVGVDPSDSTREFVPDSEERGPSGQLATQAATGTAGVRGLTHLPFESGILREGAVSMDEARRIIFANDFNEYMERVKSQSRSDPDAQRIGEIYSKEFQSALGGYDNLRFGDLACGTTVCVGVVHADGEPGRRQYSLWRTTLDRPDTITTNAFVDGEFNSGAGRIEQRFIFSMDPAVNAFHMRR